MFTLNMLGWSSFFQDQLDRLETPGLIPARVAVAHPPQYQLLTTRGVLWAEVSGRLKHEARGPEALPAVGDWVAVRTDERDRPGLESKQSGLERERPTIDGKRPGLQGERAGMQNEQPRPKGERGMIVKTLERRTRFVRRAAGRRLEMQVVAANIDTVFIVTSLNQEFNLRRIERYLTTVWDSGARPVIVLSKADLCRSVPEYLAQLEAVAVAVDTLVVSVREGLGLEPLRAWLQPGQTVALVGSSGVGKSTLVNWLLNREAQAVQEVREDDDHGRHTTTHRELFLLPEGGLLIDTPGMRELQLWAGEEGVLEVFDDITALAGGCRFRDCRHESEPGCAVLAAIDAGELEDGRLRGYLKMQREIAFTERQKDERARREEEQRWKQISKAQRELSRIRGR